jgi:hypothetical protein
MEQDIKNKILDKIKSGQVSMKPKAYFVVTMIAFVALSLLVLVTTIFLISYTLFSVIVSGHLLLLGFGLRGMEAFIILFPWFALLLDIVLLVLLDWLVRRFRFGYNRPIVFFFLGMTVLLVFLGYVVSVTSLHSTLLQEAEHNQLPSPLSPMVGPFYQSMRISHRANGVVQGTVTSIDGNMFTIRHDDYDTDIDDATTTIMAPAGVDVSNFLQLGDHVLVGGDIMSDGSVHAYGVTKFQTQ